MTTESERKLLFDILQDIKKKYEECRSRMNENHGEVIFFGIMDDEEERKQNSIRHSIYDINKGMSNAYENCWNLIKSKYSNWDIELAFSENENKIGNLIMEN